MYLDFYGFSEQPFNATPDPRFLFFSESHREALTSMAYGINERKGFVLISGEVGTGKTTLLRQLLANLDPKVQVIFISQTKVTFPQLLKGVLLELGVPAAHQDKPTLLRELQLYLTEKMGRDETLALIIDEAQHLDLEVMEELRLLSNLETPTSKLLQIVLSGQPELEEKLDAWEVRQFKQRIVIRRRILPLREEDCRRYIEHRLKIVGSSTSQVLTADAVSRICHTSKGIPRTINILCDNAFLIGKGLGKKKVDSLIVQEAIRHMGESSPRAAAAEKVDYKRRIHSSFPPKGGSFSRGAVVALTALGLVLAVLLVKETIPGIREYLQPKPAPLQATEEQKASLSPPESQSATAPDPTPTTATQEKAAPPPSPPPAPPLPAVKPPPTTRDPGQGRNGQGRGDPPLSDPEILRPLQYDAVRLYSAGQS